MQNSLRAENLFSVFTSCGGSTVLWRRHWIREILVMKRKTSRGRKWTAPMSPSSVVKWQCSSLVFGRCFIAISAGTPPILTEVFGRLPQSLQANFRRVPRGRRNRFHTNPLKFIVHVHTIRRLTVYGYWQRHEVNRKKGTYVLDRIRTVAFIHLIIICILNHCDLHSQRLLMAWCKGNWFRNDERDKRKNVKGYSWSRW